MPIQGFRSMLREMSIVDFAVVDRATIQFGPGLNVLTGETGAGKSIVIDALGALLGARLTSDVVRVGASSARIEGVFEAAPVLAPILEDMGLPWEDDALIISREMTAQGRGVARVNGSAVPLTGLGRIAPYLADIHGQNESLALARPAVRLDLLDAAAGLSERRAELARLVTEYRAVGQEIVDLVRDNRDLAREADLLRFQVGEIRQCAPDEGEDVRLEGERRTLAGAATLLARSAEAVALLQDADGFRPATDLLAEACVDLTALAAIDPAGHHLAERARDLAEAVGDLARSIRRYREGIDSDPARLEAIDDRLSRLALLKRKYAPDLAAVLAFAAEVEERLERIEGRADRRASLEVRQAALLHEIGGVASSLHLARTSAAVALGRRVIQELGDLRMPGADFQIKLVVREDPFGAPAVDGGRLAFDSTGFDDAIFLFGPNPGEAPRPIERIASGGELARVMLAFKIAVAAADATPVLVFDEVDSGVGGRSAHVIGQKLRELSRDHQILCVTHLPQVACFASTHLRIRKVTDGDRTVTRVDALEGEDRVEELAAMFGAGSASVAQAASMLAAARASR